MTLRELIQVNLKHQIIMQSANEKYIEIKDLSDKATSDFINARNHLNAVKMLNSIIDNSRTAYSRDIIESITASLAKCLDIILTDKSYEIELEIYSSYGKTHLKAWLIDEEGNKLPPSIVEGDMLNQVLSFCAAVILTKLRGYTSFFYDEAFASANSRSVIMIRTLLQFFIEEGFNFVFVSQNPLLFTDFDRNLIELIQDQGSVSEVKQSFIEASIDTSLDEECLQMQDRLLRGSI